MKAAKDFAAENINVMAQYSDLVTPGDIDSEQEIAKGEGCVVRDGLTKVALYRDEDGTVHRMSAVCVHLGCVVTWNGSEKTWDCPCHGSRFAPDGKVVKGPAPKALAWLAVTRVAAGTYLIDEGKPVPLGTKEVA